MQSLEKKMTKLSLVNRTMLAAAITGCMMSDHSAAFAQTTITQQDAIKCNTVFTAIGLAREGSSSSPDLHLLDHLDANIGGQNRKLWRLIIELDPNLKSDPDSVNIMYKLRDDYTAQHFDTYMSNIKLLLSDYNECRQKGIVPGEP
jgi:hypothetical protein